MDQNCTRARLKPDYTWTISGPNLYLNWTKIRPKPDCNWTKTGLKWTESGSNLG